jgi:hypothetical protein
MQCCPFVYSLLCPNSLLVFSLILWIVYFRVLNPMICDRKVGEPAYFRSYLFHVPDQEWNVWNNTFS